MFLTVPTLMFVTSIPDIEGGCVRGHHTYLPNTKRWDWDAMRSRAGARGKRPALSSKRALAGVLCSELCGRGGKIHEQIAKG